MFLVNAVGHPGDGRFRHNFAHEHHAAFGAQRRVVAPHVKTQVDLFKIGVPGDLNALDPGIEEHKPDQADVTGTVPDVQFGVCRDKRLQYCRVDAVIEKHETPPFGGEKGCGHEWAMVVGLGEFELLLMGNH